MTSEHPLRILARAFGRGVFPHQLSWVLDLPGRGLLMSAKTVAQRLRVATDGHVLEVGPGSGYYSIEAAKRVPNGSLTLLDIQPEMLEKSARRLRAAGLHNFRTQLAEGTDLPFDDASFDAIFLVTVFGEIAEQGRFLAESYRVLRDGGVISITEHHPDPDFEPASAIARALVRHGFVPGSKEGWRWAFTLHATKPSATP
jgi:ubiquinone/menaquinone biosynthesis C-methylase UbiE